MAAECRQYTASCDNGWQQQADRRLHLDKQLGIQPKVWYCAATGKVGVRYSPAVVPSRYASSSSAAGPIAFCCIGSGCNPLDAAAHGS